MRKVHAALAMLLLQACVLCGCSGASGESVLVYSVGEICDYAGVGISNRYAGVTISGEEIEVGKSDTSEVKEIKVKVGDYVKKGDVLFTYDISKTKMALEELQLNIERKKLNIHKLTQISLLI